MLGISKKDKLKKRINTLENENETLKETIKNELYKSFMNKLNEPLELDRIKKENKRLRNKVKTLKEILKGDKNV
jgi:DNA anti-recombination protein RmuC